MWRPALVATAAPTRSTISFVVTAARIADKRAPSRSAAADRTLIAH
jgi:hypothetical protein